MAAMRDSQSAKSSVFSNLDWTLLLDSAQALCPSIKAGLPLFIGDSDWRADNIGLQDVPAGKAQNPALDRAQNGVDVPVPSALLIDRFRSTRRQRQQGALPFEHAVLVTYCNSISVAEHAVMQILGLVRNYIPSYDWIIKKGWNIADFVKRAMIWRAWMLAW